MTSLPPKRWGFSKAPTASASPGPEVEHLEDDRRRPDVERDPEEALALGVHVLVVPADPAVPDR